jgi:carbonic anhydrase/acetyltransferase-like protein (isoleucine patch superfamily)
MLIERNGEAPRAHASAGIASSASVVGNVQIGAHAYVDHGVVIESSGPVVEIGAEAVVFAGAVVRSVGGLARPAFPVIIGERTLVSPSCVLTGCQVGRGCYIATGAILLQGAGAIVHATTVVPDHARVGLRHVAAPSAEGYASTADVESARRAVADLDFFETAFGASASDQARLHERVMTRLLDEVHG